MSAKTQGADKEMSERATLYKYGAMVRCAASSIGVSYLHEHFDDDVSHLARPTLVCIFKKKLDILPTQYFRRVD